MFTDNLLLFSSRFSLSMPHHPSPPCETISLLKIVKQTCILTRGTNIQFNCFTMFERFYHPFIGTTGLLINDLFFKVRLVGVVRLASSNNNGLYVTQSPSHRHLRSWTIIQQRFGVFKRFPIVTELEIS